MRKILSCMFTATVVLMLLVIPASANYTMEDALASERVYRGTPGKILNGKIDSKWDNASEYELEGRLPVSHKQTRPGLKVTFKNMWDDNNFYYLVKIVGDKDVTAGGKKMIGSFYADKTNLLLVTPVSLEDENFPQYYSTTYNGRKNDVSVKIHRDNPRTAPEGGSWETSDWIMPATWDKATDPPSDLTKSTNIAIPQILESLSIYETGDSEETYYVQAAIPWRDKSYAKSGNLIGIDVSYEDNMYKDLTEYLGLANKSANCYYAGGYGEAVSNPLFAEPRMLSGFAVTMDKNTLDVATDIEKLTSSKITLNDRKTALDIREKYNLLSAAQKALVINYGDLQKIDEKIAVLEAAKVEGSKVFAQIKSLPKKVSLNDEGTVKTVRSAYDKLNADQKMFVTNLRKLQSAENDLLILKGYYGSVDNKLPIGGTSGTNNGNNNNGNNSSSSGTGSGGNTQTTPGQGTNIGNPPSTGDTIFGNVMIAGALFLVSAAALLISKKKTFFLDKLSQKK